MTLPTSLNFVVIISNMASILAEKPWSADAATASEKLPVSRSEKLSWTDISAAKKEEVNARIPSEWLIPEDLLPPTSQTKVDDFVATSGFFTEGEIKITASSATDITANIVAGTWTAEEVTKAFCKSAAVSHQLVCSVCVDPTEFIGVNILPIGEQLDVHAISRSHYGCKGIR
jgi:hypothetical protein